MSFNTSEINFERSYYRSTVGNTQPFTASQLNGGSMMLNSQMKSVNHHHNQNQAAEINISIDFEKVMNDMRFIEEKVDQWKVQHVDTLRKNKISHITNVRKLQETIDRLNSEEQFLKLNDENSKQIIEKQKGDIQLFIDQIKELKERQDMLPHTVQHLSELLIDEQRDLNQTKQITEQVQFENNQQLYFIYKNLDYFKLYLGLDISISSDGIEFKFIKIDKIQPDKVFSVSIDIESNIYKVKRCEPSLPNIENLLNTLNETNQLSVFIRSVRKSFVSLSQKQ